MPALLINIKIDDEDKFNLFKVTMSDLRGLFDECHIKFRGSYNRLCVNFVIKLFDKNEAITLYQELEEDDWVDTTFTMLCNVKNRSVFLYFEDHKLVSTREHLKEVIDEFDHRQLDYLCYSWFQASVLGVENLLPLNPERGSTLHVIEYSKRENALIGKISPGYYSFSLVSICSVDYFKAVLSSCNMRFKFYNKTIAAILCRLFPYPGYKKTARSINYYASKCNLYFCFFPPSSPFNLEKIWFETVYIKHPLRLGILSNELYANYDDDNGSYQETLIKRGLYPFENSVDVACVSKKLSSVNFLINLKNGDLYDCAYFSRLSRIKNPPVVHISVESGKATVTCQSLEIILDEGESEYFYSNQRPNIRSMGESTINIGVFDECF